MDRMHRGELGFLDKVADSKLTEVAGCGGHEVRTWVAAYSAMAACGAYRNEILFYHDIAEWNAGMGIAQAQLQEDTEAARS